MLRPYLLVLIACLCCVKGVAQRWQCSGTSALRTEIANIEAPWLHRDHAIERSLFFLEMCPTEFLNAGENDKAGLSSWSSSLRSYSSGPREEEHRALVASVATSVDDYLPKNNQTANDVRKALLGAGAQTEATLSPGALDENLYGRALNATVTDWKQADGEFIRWLSDDLLFLLAINPGEFAAHIKNSPDVADSWLKRLDSLSFSGLPEESERVEQYKAQLIKALKARHPHGHTFLKRVLDRLQGISYHNID